MTPTNRQVRAAVRGFAATAALTGLVLIAYGLDPWMFVWWRPDW